MASVCVECSGAPCVMVCVTDTCPFLLQVEWTLLHCTAVGGSVELFEWLMANYKFDVEAKSKVLL